MTPICYIVAIWLMYCCVETMAATAYPSVSRYPTRYKTRKPSFTRMPSRPTLTPSAIGQSGGVADNGLGGSGNLTAVDIILIVFFVVFGALLIGVCGFIGYDTLNKRRTVNEQQEFDPVNAPAARYQDDDA